jgi:Uma2 family endonuclease
LAGAIKTLLTFEDFERMEDTKSRKTELLEGELTQSPPAKKKHSDSTHRLLFLLHAKLESSRAIHRDATFGGARMETGYLLGRDPSSWLVPDVSVAGPTSPAANISKAPP